MRYTALEAVNLPQASSGARRPPYFHMSTIKAFANGKFQFCLVNKLLDRLLSATFNIRKHTKPMMPSLKACSPSALCRHLFNTGRFTESNRNSAITFTHATNMQATVPMGITFPMCQRRLPRSAVWWTYSDLGRVGCNFATMARAP